MRAKRHRDCPGQRLLSEISGAADPNVILRCTRCGLPLRSPASKERGMGRRCRALARAQPPATNP